MCSTVGCKPATTSSSSTAGTSSSVVETVNDVNLVTRLADGGDNVYTVANENGKAET